MSTRLFVGSLPYSMNDAQLTDLFAQFGTVISAKVIIDRDTGRSKGFAFVEMEEAEAKAAMEKLDGSEQGEEGRKRAIVVNVAKPREERPAGGGYDNRGGGVYNRGGGGGFNRGGNRGGGNRY